MKELKAILRSLVISNAERGISASQLDRDFKCLEGSCIPFRDHGFQSLEAMLRTMTDVVKVIGNGVSAIIYPVTTEKNEHILAMVEKSKKNKKKKPNTAPPFVRKAKANAPPPRPRGNIFKNRDNYYFNNNNNNGNRNATGHGGASTQCNWSNNTDQQFNMFWNAIEPMLNMRYGPNTTQQAWGNQYGYQNNYNGRNQPRYTNNNQWQWNGDRSSTPYCANNYNPGYYSHHCCSGNAGGSFCGPYNDGYPYQQDYGYWNYSYGGWECNYSSYYGYNNGYDQYTNFAQGMNPYYY